MIYDSIFSLLIYILGILGILSGLSQKSNTADFVFKKLLLFYFVVFCPILFFVNNILYDLYPSVITSLIVFVITLFISSQIFSYHLKKIRESENG